jgi:eukaryotic-like serine/threonine-protein kinase
VQSLAAGDKLDHFTILSNLGQGAWSTAYEVRDDRDGRRVVLKCPNPVLLGDTTSLDRFRREMAIGRRLDHPNIMRALDAGEDRSAPYLILEFVEGESLGALLKRDGPLPVDKAVDFIAQILTALEYAHALRIYHRDLKPDNVLLTAGGQVKIIDFGIAYMAGVRRLTWRWAGNTLGTPNYMAPEQVQGRRGDARSDLYATGAMFYEMLTGRPPFEGKDALDVMHQHLAASPSPPSRYNSRVPSGLDGIVLKSLRKNAEERYQSASEFAADLARYPLLQLADFCLPREQPLDEPHPDRLLAIIAGSLAAGFVALSAVIVGISYLFAHH